MKKLAVVLLLISVWACEKESTLKEQITAIEEAPQEVIESKQSSDCYPIYGYSYSPNCFNPPCIVIVDWICPPYETPTLNLDDCPPCSLMTDPFKIIDHILPERYVSLKDKLKLEIDIRNGLIPFVINENIMVLQFYSQNKMMSFDRSGQGIFTLDDSIIFDAETSKNIGLRGNVVTAGKYPISYNKENETYNVIVAVETGFTR
ncbi:hypothetical protein ACSTS3_21210 [Aquimarina muelleri]|uniref:hypothetical protein n=1 Tax=Aquimarina muelleri TaxID=279356 RepID=UPI003F685960